MTNFASLPSPPQLASLQHAGRAALYLDFDGTLVDIADSPDAIAVDGQLGRRLERLSRKLDCALAIVSGRSIDNLLQFLGPVSLFLAGSHGGHVRSPDGVTLHEVDGLPEAVKLELDSFARKTGLLYEPKSHGAALHYRSNPQLAHEANAFARDLADQYGLGTKEGKCVIEIVRQGIDKGRAVQLLSEKKPFVGAKPIFIGDDVTDEDGFAACNQKGGFGIVIGGRDATAASYQLNSVTEVHQWLNL